MSFNRLGDGQGYLSQSRPWLEASSQPLQPSLAAAGARGRPFCRRTPNPKIWEAAGGTVHIKGRRLEGSTHVGTRALRVGFLGCHQSLGEAVVAQCGARDQRSEIWPVFTGQDATSP